MKNIILIIFVLIFASSCATTYQKSGFSSGYSEIQLDKNDVVGTISPWRSVIEASTNCIDKVYYNVKNNYNYQACKKTLDYIDNNKNAKLNYSDVYDKYIKESKVVDYSWFSDYICFIDPMDKHPRNIVKVFSSIGYIYELHADDSNLAINISDTKKIKITDKLRFQEWKSFENYKLESGKFFVIDKFSDGNDEKIGIYYRNGKGGGESYKCSKVSIYKTKSNTLSIKPYNEFKYLEQGVKDFERKNSKYKASCKNNNPKACYNLGISYRYGYGVSKSLKKAAKLYHKACLLKHGGACSSYGSIVEWGFGDIKQRDMVEALKFHELGCKYGSSKACGATAWFYKSGNGVKQDLKKSYKLYKIACDDNNAIACGGMAGLYKIDAGIVSLDERKRLLNKSCNLGHKMACNTIKNIKQ